MRILIVNDRYNQQSDSINNKERRNQLDLQKHANLSKTRRYHSKSSLFVLNAICVIRVMEKIVPFFLTISVEFPVKN